MYKLKKLLRLMLTLLVAVIVCIGCRETNVLDAAQRIYDEGLSKLEKAESREDAQKIYDETVEQLKYFIADHKNEIAALDSTENALQKAEDTFLKACCMKAANYDGSIETARGYASIDDSGSLFIYNPEEDNSREQRTQQNNPLDIIAMIPIYKANQVDDEVHYSFERVMMKTSNGECIYDDQLIEQYITQYVPVFFMAYIIAKDGKDFAPYLKEHLLDVISNLPLNESYPKDLREYVNKKYYDYKDKVEHMNIYKREYGFIEFAYDLVKGIYGEQNIKCFKVYRDKDTGRLSFGTSLHGYNPPTAY